MNNFKVFQSRAKNQYDLAIYQFGYEKCTADQRFGSKRDCYLLHFVVSGKGRYKVRGKTYEVGKDDCFLVIPDEDTYYEANRDDPYEYYWIGFRGVNARQLMEGLGFYDDNFVYRCNPQESEIIKKYMSNIVAKGKVDEKSYLYALGHLYLILSLLTRSTEDISCSVKMDEDTWREVNEYVAFNYGNQITIDDLSKKFGFHRTSLYKLFKRNSGMSPSEYILNYRLDRAMNLVKTTNWFYKTIAFECGFNNLTYFYKAFKKKFKRTPHQIRELN